MNEFQHRVFNKYYDEHPDEFWDDLKQEACRVSIPKQYVSKVCSYAYREGHSHGYSEVYLTLLGVAEIFAHDEI